MTSDRVARIKRGYEHWNRGEPLPTENVSPDFEFHPPPDLSGESTRRGEGAGEAFKEGIEDAFSVKITLLDTREHGDQIIAHVRVETAGRHTGIEMSREEFHVYSFEGRLLRSIRCFVAEEDADAAAREHQGSDPLHQRGDR